MWNLTTIGSMVLEKNLFKCYFLDIGIGAI